ncbi:mitochondrial transcription rescue factor 1 [Megalopta genalis]|uniref:mitochondrial transcription rescue factor 1 n=1 Tax=Megalopta genalis TaxID=115081 RepID=UPI003FD00BE6
MLWRTTSNLVRHTIFKNRRMYHTLYCMTFICQQHRLDLTYSYLQTNPISITQKRLKSNKQISERGQDDSDEEESKVDNYLQTKTTKVINTTIPSLRLDVVTKVAFGLSRNKVDKAFYNSNLRVNGQKYLKKSKMVDVEDEIDLVLGKSNNNPAFLTVHRCILLSAKPSEEGVEVKLLRNKSLLIEDYDDPWNGVS